jgi:hypothetical protein
VDPLRLYGGFRHVLGEQGHALTLHCARTERRLLEVVSGLTPTA